MRAKNSLSEAAWRWIALCTAGAFFWLATRVDVYDATSPHALIHSVFGANIAAFPHPWWFSVHIWLRKLYSIVAFASVGLTTHKAHLFNARPRLRVALLVALYSAGIEFAQFAVDPAEPVGERTLDIFCGATGGWLGVFWSQMWESRQQTLTR